MGKPYSSELDLIPQTYSWVMSQNTEFLSNLVEHWANDYLYIVGSGGSFAAANAIADLRAIASSSISLAVTPLEFLLGLRKDNNARVLLLTAEGKNADILTAAKAGARHDHSIAAMTLTPDNPLIRFGSTSGTIRTFHFDMPWIKDGYLATNTLLAIVLLFYKAQLGSEALNRLAPYFSEQAIRTSRDAYLKNNLLKTFLHTNIVILFDPVIKTAAIDLESRLAESALAKVELVDFRQFGHGRHLQLTTGNWDTRYIALYTDGGLALAEKTLSLIPNVFERYKLQIQGERPEELIVSSLLQTTLLIESISQNATYDPGQPHVPEFGISIHKIDISEIYNELLENPDVVEVAARRKTLGSYSHSTDNPTYMAATSYKKQIEARLFKALICDFDGTLCNTEERYVGMNTLIADQIERLLEEGMNFAVISGRGGSLQTCLKDAIPNKYHAHVWVGYYGGAVVSRLSEELVTPSSKNIFAPFYQWLKTTSFHTLREEEKINERGGQLSIRVESPAQSRPLREAIHSWLHTNRHQGWRIYSSGHSLDLLNENTSKSIAVNDIAEKFGLNPESDILFIGDNGQESGNDYELLNRPNSLSADRVSTSLLNCWNFAPSGCHQFAATHFYLRNLKKQPGGHRLTLLG